MKILLRESQINGLIEDLKKVNDSDNYYSPDLNILSVNEFVYPESHYYAGVKAVKYVVGDEKPLGEVVVSDDELLKYSNTLNEQMAVASRPTIKQGTSKIDPDDVIDYTSAGFDTIPGIGNLVSLGIDAVHAGTYAYRYLNAKSDQQKIEYGIMGLITLLTMAIPVMGNSTNIAARGGIKTFVRRTPEEVLHIVQKLGLYNKKIWPLQKYKWSFNVGLFLYKVTKSEIEEITVPLLNKLRQVSNMVKKTPLEKPFMEFKDMVDEINANKEIYSKVIQYV